MEAGDTYGRRGLPVLATMLADALMAGSSIGRARGEYDGGDKPARPPVRVRAGGALSAALGAVDRWLHRQTMRRWEAYLAQAQNLQDLEARIRRLEQGDRKLY